MSFTEDPKGWARDQVERLRADPRAWAREQAERARTLVDVAPFSEEALQRELLALRGAFARLRALSPEERVALHDALLALHERLTPAGALVSGAKLGLAAAVLPLVGVVTGPLLGGAYGVYRSQRLAEVRSELHTMLREVARGESRPS
ncbi:MAG: hypothetical protein R3B09_09215 [Nannocystaceae bacterium]